MLRCNLLFEPHHFLLHLLLLLVLFCQIFMPLVKCYRYVCKLKCEPESVSIKSNAAALRCRIAVYQNIVTEYY